MSKLQHFVKLVQDLIDLNLSIAPEYKIKTKELKELFGLDNSTLSNVIAYLRKNNYIIIRNEGEITIKKEKIITEIKGNENEEVFKPTHPFVKYRTRNGNNENTDYNFNAKL